ncbi:hypothetical protein CHI08_25980, partial [Peribacillus simplex]
MVKLEKIKMLSGEMSLNRLKERVYCSKCKQKTNHLIIYTHTEKSNNNDEIQWQEQHHVVQCAGCDTKAFVKQYGDEDTWVYRGEERVWTDVFTVYPEEPISEPLPYYWLEKKEFRNVPETINQLYLQIIDVYNKGYLLLATIGIRTIIEAICLDVGIKQGYLY